MPRLLEISTPLQWRTIIFPRPQMNGSTKRSHSLVRSSAVYSLSFPVTPLHPSFSLFCDGWREQEMIFSRKLAPGASNRSSPIAREACETRTTLARLNASRRAQGTATTAARRRRQRGRGGRVRATQSFPAAIVTALSPQLKVRSPECEPPTGDSRWIDSAGAYPR